MTRRATAHLLVGLIAVATVAYPSAAGAQREAAAIRAAGVVAAWSRGGTIDPLTGAPKAVSCPRPSFCAAVDSNGSVLVYNGKSWSSPESIDPGGGGFTSVSCPITTFCAAVDENDSALTYDGTSWSKPVKVDSSGFSLSAVSCPRATSCVAVDRGGFAVVYNGRSWAGLRYVGHRGARPGHGVLPEARSVHRC